MTVIDFGVNRDSNESKQSQIYERTSSGTTEKHVLSSLWFFKMPRCNSGTSRSLGSQQRGKQNLKVQETNSGKCYLNTWSSCVWSQKTNKKTKEVSSSIFFFFLASDLLNQNVHSNKIPQWFVCPLKFQKHWLAWAILSCILSLVAKILLINTGMFYYYLRFYKTEY